MIAIACGFHLLAGHAGNMKATTGRCNSFPGHKCVGGSCFLLMLGVALQINRLVPGDRLDTGNMLCGAVGVHIKLPLPCTDAGCPAEAVGFQLVPRPFVRLAVEEDLQAVVCFVCFHTPTVKLPSGKLGILMLPYLFDTRTNPANFRVIVGEDKGLIRPAFVKVPGLRHVRFQLVDLLRR